jgi:serine/threonine-protein kinase HipA
MNTPTLESPKVVAVHYGNQAIGRIAELGHATLWEWDPSYVTEGVELSPVLPLAVPRSEHRDTYFHRLPPLLADSIPDSYGLGVMNESLKQLGYTNITTLDRLAYVGDRGVGALSFLPSLATDPEASEPTIQDLQEYAAHYKTEPEEVSWKVLRRTTNLGGAQPKSAISYNPATRRVQTGIKIDEGFRPMIVKFQFEPGDEQTNTEHALALLAKECGIRMPATRLIEDRGYQHFAIERFDIFPEGKRIHYQSYATMTGNNYAPYSFPDYAHLILEVKNRTLRYGDVLELYRRMLYNITVNNWDDHQRNHGFLMDDAGEWRLSPAFDINYAIPGSTDARACTVNRKGFNISWEDCLEVASAASLSIREAHDLEEQVREGLKQWEVCAEQAGLTEGLVDEIRSNFVHL